MKAFLPGLLILFCVAFTDSANADEQPDRGFNEKAIQGAWGKFEDPGRMAGDEQWQTTLKQLSTGNFAGLDAQAAKYRAEKAQFPSGMWRILAFYEDVGDPPNDTPDGWKKHEALLDQWIHENPHSVTALIAKAKFLTRYAWKARGNGLANTVTPEGWKLLAERLAKATELLGDARRMGEKDPFLWSVAQTAALGLGAERESYEKLFKEATAFEPKFFSYYQSKAYHLLPRWHGQPGEWEQFAEESIKTCPLGIEIYARIVFAMSTHHTNVFAESKASWEKAKSGFEQIRQRYPDSTLVIRDYLKLCKQANDRVQAQALLKALDYRLDSKVWRKVEIVTDIYKWAYDDGK